jgi:proteasome assembly chaperone (PAC2) family protein
MSEHDVSYSERPTLRKPILIAAFEGWNDAAEAATSAIEHLQDMWDATSFATIDPEEFYDFTEVRPTVRMGESDKREIDWPTNEFFYHQDLDREHDFILLLGVEPSLKWRRFTEAIIGVAREFGVTSFISLGALLSDVPHGRQARVTASATDPKLRERIGRSRASRYEGPTGIVGILQDAFGKAEIPGASLWGHAPHYLSASPNPVVTLGILRRLDEIFDLELDLSELEGESTTFVSQVNEAVSRDPEASSYIHQLESQNEDEDEDEEPEPFPRQANSGKSLIEDVEDFLRRRWDKD